MTLTALVAAVHALVAVGLLTLLTGMRKTGQMIRTALKGGELHRNAGDEDRAEAA